MQGKEGVGIWEEFIWLCLWRVKPWAAVSVGYVWGRSAQGSPSHPAPVRGRGAAAPFWVGVR